MQYQTDARDFRRAGVRIGLDNQEIAVFARARSLLHHLEGTVDGVEYRMKLPAPWTGFRYQLLNGKVVVANGKRVRKMHAFDPERPLIRHHRVEFELDVDGQFHRLVPDDRHGLIYAVLNGAERLGSLSNRSFEDQRGAPWEADAEVPDDWSVPLIAFVTWLVREGRSVMNSR